MKIELKGSEAFAVSRRALWNGLNDPAVLTKCIPGCTGMVESGPDAYDVTLQLKVSAVGGSFGGKVRLFDKAPPETCRITVSGEGTLGTGTGTAAFSIAETADGVSLDYEGEGEIGGLVVGVGQRVLGAVAKQLTRRFFTALRAHVDSVDN